MDFSTLTGETASPALVQTPQKRRVGQPNKAPEVLKNSPIQILMSEDCRQWYREYAKDSQLSISELVHEAVCLRALKFGYRKPIPPR